MNIAKCTNTNEETFQAERAKHIVSRKTIKHTWRQEKQARTSRRMVVTREFKGLTSWHGQSRFYRIRRLKITLAFVMLFGCLFYDKKVERTMKEETV